MNYITQFLSIKKNLFLNKSLVSVVSLLTITLLFVYMFYTGGNHSARIVLTSPNQAIPPKNWSLENKNAYIEFRKSLIQMENLLGNSAFTVTQTNQQRRFLITKNLLTFRLMKF